VVFERYIRKSPKASARPSSSGPDLRNSKVEDIIKEFKDYGVEVQVHDPLADAAEAAREYNVVLTPFDRLAPATALVVAVSHRPYIELSVERLLQLLAVSPVLADIKGLYDPRLLADAGIRVWRL
jgi:UDP-N-acetyl-D-galactosamine dehydrogenase